jgi:Protein of unknown function (DUF3309)
MSIGTILLIVLILILLGVLPTWPHARSWGYGPSGNGTPPRRRRMVIANGLLAAAR